MGKGEDRRLAADKKAAKETEKAEKAAARKAKRDAKAAEKGD